VEEMVELDSLYRTTGGDGWKCGAKRRSCLKPPPSDADAEVVSRVLGGGGEEGVMGEAWAVGLATGWLDTESGQIKGWVSDCCSWYGIRCRDAFAAPAPGECGGHAREGRAREGGEGVRGGSITAIELAGNSLVGELPYDFGRGLPCLQLLDLSQNSLTGSIPPTLAADNTSSLRDLLLHDNQLQGTLPDSFQTAVNLRRLILAGNQLAGSIPTWLGLLPHLEMLIMNDNLLHGTIPRSLAHMRKLTHIYLHNNRLHGLIPHELVDSPFAPDYLLVNGRSQPHRLSFDVPPADEEAARTHFAVRASHSVERLVHSDMEEQEMQANTEEDADKRHRLRKIREHKERIVERMHRINKVKGNDWRKASNGPSREIQGRPHELDEGGRGAAVEARERGDTAGQGAVGGGDDGGVESRSAGGGVQELDLSKGTVELVREEL